MQALSDVHHERVMVPWAVNRADHFNAHFSGKDTVAWLPDDFLGIGNREKRQREQQMEMLAVMKANSQLAKIRRGDAPPDDVAKLFSLGLYDASLNS